MKKNLLAVVVAAVAVTTLAGCGNTKTLTCTSESDELKQTQIYKYEKDELKKVTMEEEIEAESDDEAKELKATVEEEMKFFDMDGVTAKVSQKGKKVTATVEMTIDKLSDEYKSSINTQSYDDVKTSLEADGYSCK